MAGFLLVIAGIAGPFIGGPLAVWFWLGCPHSDDNEGRV